MQSIIIKYNKVINSGVCTTHYTMELNIFVHENFLNKKIENMVNLRLN